MFCPNCGQQMDETAAFCPRCGSPAGSGGAAKVTRQPSPSVLILTSNYAPGYRTDKVLGIVYGITVRSRGLGGNLVAGLKSIAGGEILEYTELAQQARQQALDRLAEHAASLGANAVLSVMFDSSSISATMEEIIAFGTAVVVSPVTDAQQLVKLS
jgi:uncharacterized protein YbjQ (UPF0145 family)